MTELAYYQALSALLYLIIAVMFYRKIKTGIHKDRDGHLAEVYDDAGLSHDAGQAASKTVAFVMCLFWPIAFLSAVFGKKGGAV